MSPAITWSKIAVTDAWAERSADASPGPSHWITGVTPGPITVMRYRSPGAGGRIAWLGYPGKGCCGTKLWQKVPLGLWTRIPDSRFQPGP